MLKNFIQTKFLNYLLTIIKGGPKWLIALVAGAAIALSAAFGFSEESSLAEFAQSVLGIACE